MPRVLKGPLLITLELRLFGRFMSFRLLTPIGITSVFSRFIFKPEHAWKFFSCNIVSPRDSMSYKNNVVSSAS